MVLGFRLWTHSSGLPYTKSSSQQSLEPERGGNDLAGSEVCGIKCIRKRRSGRDTPSGIDSATRCRFQHRDAWCILLKFFGISRLRAPTKLDTSNRKPIGAAITKRETRSTNLLGSPKAALRSTASCREPPASLRSPWLQLQSPKRLQSCSLRGGLQPLMGSLPCHK